MSHRKEISNLQNDQDLGLGINLSKQEDSLESEALSMKCPASMCPLIAPDGSPWTGHKDAICPGHDDLDSGGCPWWSMGCGSGDLQAMVDEALAEEGRVLVVGPNKPRRIGIAESKSFDCPRAGDCRWQESAQKAGLSLCPPRAALAVGLDPRVCAF